MVLIALLMITSNTHAVVAVTHCAGGPGCSVAAVLSVPHTYAALGASTRQQQIQNSGHALCVAVSCAAGGIEAVLWTWQCKQRDELLQGE